MSNFNFLCPEFLGIIRVLCNEQEKNWHDEKRTVREQLGTLPIFSCIEKINIRVNPVVFFNV